MFRLLQGMLLNRPHFCDVSFQFLLFVVRQLCHSRLQLLLTLIIAVAVAVVVFALPNLSVKGLDVVQKFAHLLRSQVVAFIVVFAAGTPAVVLTDFGVH